MINRVQRWGAISSLKLTHFLDKCRGHSGQSKRQCELVSRNSFYSWESYIRGKWAWLSFVTGIKSEALESWHFVKMPFLSCAVRTLHFVWKYLPYEFVNIQVYRVTCLKMRDMVRQFSISFFIGEKIGGWILCNWREDGYLGAGDLSAFSEGLGPVNSGGSLPCWQTTSSRTILTPVRWWPGYW